MIRKILWVVEPVSSYPRRGFDGCWLNEILEIERGPLQIAVAVPFLPLMGVRSRAAVLLAQCGFRHFPRSARMQDRKQLRIVSSSKTNRNKVNAPTATDSQLVAMGQRTKRSESSLDYSERIAYEPIARALTPRKRV